MRVLIVCVVLAVIGMTTTAHRPAVKHWQDQSAIAICQHIAVQNLDLDAYDRCGQKP